MSELEPLSNVVLFPERETAPFEFVAHPYAELAAATNFSFLRGASTGKDMVLASVLLGYTGLGIADRNTISGVVRAWAALNHLREEGVQQP